MPRYEFIRYNIFKNKVGSQPIFKVCISRKIYIKMHCSCNESDYYTMLKHQYSITMYQYTVNQNKNVDI